MKEIYNAEHIIYGSFMSKREQDSRPYIQVVEQKQLMDKMKGYLNEYNQYVGQKKQMNIVMFTDACHHVAKICRVLRNPKGHILLMGVGGSGRQSLSKLSAYIMNLKIQQIQLTKGYNMNKWRDDIKKIIISLVENTPCCFLFLDSQIINEQMTEDVSSLLSSGYIVGLPYTPDEQKTIEDTARKICIMNKAMPNKINTLTAVNNRIKENVHVVMSMSPLGGKFGTRLKMFPSLINNCYLDWFSEWPEEALFGVAN